MNNNINEINGKDKEIIDICYANYNKLLTIPNVVGLGLGKKIINGLTTNEKCITIFVDKKINALDLNVEDVVPPIYEGIKTDIVETSSISTIPDEDILNSN